MNDEQRLQCADNLRLARRSCVPIDPVMLTYPNADVDDAYAVQLAQVHSWVADGQRVIGHKVGLSSPVVQSQMGIDEPDYGHLTADMCHPENHPIAIDHFILPQIQPVTAFVLGRRLAGPGVTVVDVIRAVEFVLPALEIVDSRFKAWNLTVVDTIADNASAGAVVLGSRPMLLPKVDLNSCSVEIYLNGEPATSGLGSAVLGSPLNAVVWLANILGRRGLALEEGHVVLPGSATRATCLLAGDVVEAVFGGIGSVRCLVAPSSANPQSRRHAAAPLHYWTPDLES